ncbi:MAG: hypothetical protein U0Q16_32695 [Bryobacteraceae bacterium]
MTQRKTTRKRFSTSTVAGDEFVPWLAATGELAYSPESPPERDYFFQYSWVVPGVLVDAEHRRRHHWFGESRKDDRKVQLLFRFWNRARRGERDALYLANGTARPGAVTAPIAAYRHTGIDKYGGNEQRLIMLQHGSYYIGDPDGQPSIDRGEAVLYRGVKSAATYMLYRLTTPDVRKRLLEIHARTLADSVDSFNAVHCNLRRCETGMFNDGSFVFDDHCREAGLDPKNPEIRSILYSGYALEEWCAWRKFGPNYVKFRTPLTNLRITTFVCGETEVKVVDPNELHVTEAIGCTVREVQV